MLGNIAKKLRLFGFDTLYFSNIQDDELLFILQNEDRILITKDNQLSQKAQKLNNKVIFLTVNTEYEQFIQIKKQLYIENFSIDMNNTRCTLCNGHLDNIDKSTIQNNIPEKVLEFINNFWECNECSKVYWEGNHIINLQNFVRRINEQ